MDFNRLQINQIIINPMKLKLFSTILLALVILPVYLTNAQKIDEDDIFIKKVEIYKVNLDLKAPYTIATGTVTAVEAIFLRVYTNTNIYGVGESTPVTVIQGETQETAIAMAKLSYFCSTFNQCS